MSLTLVLTSKHYIDKRRLDRTTQVAVRRSAHHAHFITIDYWNKFELRFQCVKLISHATYTHKKLSFCLYFGCSYLENEWNGVQPESGQ